MILDLTTFEDDYNESEISGFEKVILVTLEHDYFDEGQGTLAIVPFEEGMTLEENSEDTISNPPQLIIFHPDYVSTAYSRFEFDYVTPEIASQIRSFFNL